MYVLVTKSFGWPTFFHTTGCRKCRCRRTAVQILCHARTVQYETAKAQYCAQYNSSCYSCLVERILKRRSSAPSGSQQRVLVPDSYSTLRYSIRTCEHLTPCHAFPSLRRVTICTLSLACTERYRGPLGRLTHLDKARQTRSRTSRERSAGFALATHVDQC